MMYQDALQLFILNVSGVDTADTVIRFVLEDKLYTLTGDVTWGADADDMHDSIGFGIVEVPKAEY